MGRTFAAIASAGFALAAVLLPPALAQLRGYTTPEIVRPPPPLPPRTGPDLGTSGPGPLQGTLGGVPKGPELDPGIARPAQQLPEAARAVRFSCEVAPYEEACRQAGVPDGGGDDQECRCGRDNCREFYDAAAGYTRRTCDKLQ